MPLRYTEGDPAWRPSRPGEGCQSRRLESIRWIAAARDSLNINMNLAKINAAQRDGADHDLLFKMESGHHCTNRASESPLRLIHVCTFGSDSSETLRSRHWQVMLGVSQTSHVRISIKRDTPKHRHCSASISIKSSLIATRMNRISAIASKIAPVASRRAMSIAKAHTLPFMQLWGAAEVPQIGCLSSLHYAGV